MSGPPESPGTRPPGPPRSGWNTALAVALAFVLAGMLHYLASRHYARRDVSRIQFYGLSDRTLSVLDRVAEPVTAILYFEPGLEGYADIENLLREYESRSRHFRVSRIDPDRNPARAREILETYPVTRPNVLILSAGDGHRILEREDLFHYDLSRVREGGRPFVSAFLGERLITSALHDLVTGIRPVVYFIEGHGQRSIESHEPRTGLAELARRIRQDNVETRVLRLGETRAIPEDCDVLAIAGPRRRFSQPEVDLIAEYLLRRGGRLLALLDAQTDTGLDPLLLRWGIRVGNDVAVDPTRTQTGMELFLHQTFGSHPITNPLRAQGLSCLMVFPRTVEPAEPETAPAAPDRPSVTRLAMTTAAGWAESDPTRRPMTFDEGEDRRGPVSVAVAAEKGSPPGLDVQIRPTRLVVVGDSFFVANGNLVLANADLVVNAIHWMVDRPELLPIAAKSTEAFRLVLTAGQVRLIGGFSLLGLPALAAAIGLGVAARRRK